MPDAIGQTLGQYRIVRKLGAGGMGEVYLAHDPTLERDVALKVLPAESFSDPTARGRLLREARSAAGLNHPHICTIYEVGEAEGQAYIAMELVEGESLSARLARGPLPPEQMARYALQLADALGHAHDRGVVHRDLKSANVVVGADGRAKVLDFGLAKRMPSEATEDETGSHVTLTKPGTIMGTLPYMAPEQLRGEAVDMRCDIWALGVMLYEMAAGARPFQGNTGFQLSSEILNQPPPALPAKVPLALRGVIERCLEKEPGRRYQRAGEVRAALEAQQTGTVSPFAGWRYIVPRRRWLLAAAAGAVVTVLAAWLDVGGVGRRLFEGTGGPGIESLVVLPLANLSGDPTQDFFADGMTEALIAELSQIGDLEVVSRTSAMQYKDTTKSMRDIVDELGIDGVIEGGVLREGDQVRVTINLVSARTDKTLWAQSFDRESTGILALYSDVVRAIAGEVRVTLSPQHEEALLARARSVDPEAYEAYLKGRMYWYKQTPQDLDRAMQYFQFAQEKDPDFALGYLGMGYVWTYYASTGLAPTGEMRASMMEAVRKARELDPTLAEAYEAEADFQFYYDWDWAAAEENYQRAIELKPKSAEMRFYYWEFLVAMKRIEEAEEQIKHSVELDPFNTYVQLVYGLFLTATHRFDEAIDQFHEVLRSEVDFGPAHLGLWQAYHHQGMHEEALASAREYFSKWGDDEMVGVLDAGFAEGGYQEAMRQAAQELVRRSEQFTILAVQVAQLFAYAGDEERALDWLEKAYEQRETGLVKLQVDPDWDTLRHDPRFQDLLSRMDFPPA